MFCQKFSRFAFVLALASSVIAAPVSNLEARANCADGNPSPCICNNALGIRKSTLNCPNQSFKFTNPASQTDGTVSLVSGNTGSVQCDQCVYLSSALRASDDATQYCPRHLRALQLGRRDGQLPDFRQYITINAVPNLVFVEGTVNNAKGVVFGKKNFVDTTQKAAVPNGEANGAKNVNPGTHAATTVDTAMTTAVGAGNGFPTGFQGRFDVAVKSAIATTKKKAPTLTPAPAPGDPFVDQTASVIAKCKQTRGVWGTVQDIVVRAVTGKAAATAASCPLPATKPTATATSAPAKKPAATAPANKPAVAPAKKPTTAAPVKKPTTAPAKKPPTAPPAKKPAAAPAKKPTTAAPAKKPVAAAPAKKPTTAAPVKKPPAKKPTTAVPAKKPITPAPVKKPATVAPTKKPVVAKKPAAPAAAKKPVVPKPAPAKKPVPKPVDSAVTKWFIRHRTLARRYCIEVLPWVLTVVGPILLQHFSKTNDLARVAEAILRGCTALTIALLLLVLHALIIDLDQWLSPPIEGHTTTSHTPLDIPPPLGMLVPSTFLGRLFCLPCLVWFVAYQWLVTDAVLLVRIDAAVRCTLRATESLSAVFLLLLILGQGRAVAPSVRWVRSEVPHTHEAGKTSFALALKDAEKLSVA
ncbi:hypothetical protein C8R47DRAFT_1209776 [Mycena vitilis]|nr:hypothetical protein C8R47DRAFT_1209776 [Mycena vitilis]